MNRRALCKRRRGFRVASSQTGSSAAKLDERANFSDLCHQDASCSSPPPGSSPPRGSSPSGSSPTPGSSPPPSSSPPPGSSPLPVLLWVLLLFHLFIPATGFNFHLFLLFYRNSRRFQMCNYFQNVTDSPSGGSRNVAAAAAQRTGKGTKLESETGDRLHLLFLLLFLLRLSAAGDK